MVTEEESLGSFGSVSLVWLLGKPCSFWLICESLLSDGSTGSASHAVEPAFVLGVWPLLEKGQDMYVRAHE